MSRKRSPKQKLLGWGILAAAGVVIVAVFLVTRLVSSPAPSNTTTVATAASSTPAPAASSSDSAPPSATSSATAAASSEQQPSAPPASSPAASSAPTLVDAAAMDQLARKDMLLRLINQGVFSGVDALGSPPKVGVTALFKGLNPNMQSEFVGLVYAYVNNGAASSLPLQIIDAQTGTPAGTYTTDGGLKLL